MFPQAGCCSEKHEVQASQRIRRSLTGSVERPWQGTGSRWAPIMRLLGREPEPGLFPLNLLPHASTMMQATGPGRREGRPLF